jgi:hypothetical protein
MSVSPVGLMFWVIVVMTVTLIAGLWQSQNIRLALGAFNIVSPLPEVAAPHGQPRETG